MTEGCTAAILRIYPDEAAEPPSNEGSREGDYSLSLEGCRFILNLCLGDWRNQSPRQSIHPTGL